MNRRAGGGRGRGGAALVDAGAVAGAVEAKCYQADEQKTARERPEAEQLIGIE